MKELYLRAEQRALRQQQFDLEREAARRPLTKLETDRLKQVKDELRDLQPLLDDARKAQTPRGPR